MPRSTARHTFRKSLTLAGWLLALAAGAGAAHGQTPFASIDVGAGSTGSTTVSGDTLTMTSTGADIWEMSDAFRFAYVAHAGDAEVVARVAAYSGPSEWGKAGVLFRETTDPGSRFIDLVRTRDHGLEFQSRTQTNAAAQTIETARTVTGLPVWVRLTREVNRFTAFYKTRFNDPWTELGRVTFDLPETLLAGLAVTSGGGASAGSATFINPAVEGLACVETPPEIQAPDSTAVFEDATLAIDLADYSFSNSCSGKVTYSVVAGPGAISGSRYTWTPTTPGDFQVIVRAANLGGFAETAFQVQVLSQDEALPALHVEGNQILDADGNRVILRGVAVADVKRLNTSRPGWSAASIMEHAADNFAARVIRLTVLPGEWFADPTAYLNDHLDPAVQWALAHGVYVIIDWHYVAGGGDADPLYTELDDETRAFWNVVAPRYSGVSNVLFELFNEPATPADWAVWKSFAQPWVDLIRAHAPDNLLLVSGYWYSSQIFPAIDDPFEGDNLVYVAHAYPDQAGFTNPNPESVWEENWGVVADHFPVFLTEWGYENVPGHHWSGGTQENYGDPLQAFVEAHGIHWTAWCFDHSWGPKMFDGSWNLLGGNNFHGVFVRDWLLAHRNNDVPVIALSALELDFGLNRAGQEKTLTFEVANTGQGPLELSITSDHPQFVVAAPDFSAPVIVAVGDTLTVEVTFLSQGGGVQQGVLTLTHNAVGKAREMAVFGLSRGTSTDADDAAATPATFELLPNYPNPFNPETVIPYQVARAAHLTLRVYDATGRVAATLLDERVTPGSYTARFRPGPLPSGFYLVEMTADGVRLQTRTLLFVK